jgi:DnaJ-domain-containing protein 1
MSHYFIDNEDSFDTQLKEQQHKKQKKLEKQERLNRKKNLLDEIKSTLDQTKNQTPSSINTPQSQPNIPLFIHERYKRGTSAWALHILEAESLLSFSEIKKRYLQLAQQYHPDKNNGENTEKIKELNEAWEIIRILSR